MAKIGFLADFPQISRSGIPDFPRCNPFRIKENENKCILCFSSVKF
jgi:hypothetical protein